MTEERTFPRGGGESSRNQSDVHKDSQQSKHHRIFKDSDLQDGTSELEREPNLFSRLKKQKVSHDRRKTVGKAAKNNKLKVEQLIEKEETIVEHLTYSALTPGMLLLGRIKEFLGTDISVVLPGGLRGFISPFDISESFSKRLGYLQNLAKREEEEVQQLIKLFPPGKLVLCKIKNIEIDPATAKSLVSRTRVYLTINPKDIVPPLSHHLYNGLTLSAAVESIEEHGYVMDVGLADQGIQAFLPLEKSKLEGETDLAILQVGQVILCAIESGGKKTDESHAVRALKLTINTAATNLPSKKISPANLLPGAIVDVHITGIHNSGLRVQCGSVQGFVSRFHLISSTDSLQNYKVDQTISSRVIYVNPVTKQAAFTLKTSLWSSSTCDTTSHGDLYEGCVVNEAQVIDVLESVGVYLHLPNGSTAFCSRKNLGIASAEMMKSSYNINSRHSCVVIGFNDLDEIVLVSLKPSLVSQPVLSYQQLSPGQVVQGKVAALVPSGIVVLISERVHGFIPSTHLSEVPLKHWEKKFSDGVIISCMVMEVDPSRRSLILTHKKSLMEASTHLCCYEDAEVGKIYLGVIQKIKNSGMLIRFFQSVHGWVPREEFDDGISLENLYYEGQTVRCRVLRCDRKTNNLHVSLKLIKSSPDAKVPESSEVGSVQQCRVANTTAKGVQVVLLPSEARGFIPLSHLADSAAECSSCLQSFQPNQFIRRAVIIKMYPLILSIKASYIEAAVSHDLPTSYSEIHLGRQCVATVNNVKNYGIFLDVCNGVGGLLPNRLVDLPEGDTLTPGDSVLVKVEEIQEEKQRLLFRMLNRIGRENQHNVQLENHELRMDAPISVQTARITQDTKSVGAHKFGDIVSAKIVAVESSRLKLRTRTKMPGYVRQCELSDKCDSKKASLSFYHVGQMVSARVIGQKNPVFGKAKSRRVLIKKVARKPPVYDFSTRASVLSVTDLDELREMVARNSLKKIEVKRESLERQSVDVPSVTHVPDSFQKGAPHVGQLLPRLPDVPFTWDEEDKETINIMEVQNQGGDEQASSKSKIMLDHSNERRTYDRERLGTTTEENACSADEFEKILLSRKDDSMLWMRYMAFLIENGKLDEARQVAQRALKTISFREESEKLNIWIALLNLENLHGTRDSLEDCFQNALQHADPLKIYRQMAAIFNNTGKHEQALTTYKKMTSRFKDVKEVWMDYGSFLMSNGKSDDAHLIMQKSLQLLDPKSQVDIIVKFAILELQHGSKERARTMFENLISTYPKRTDCLHIYLSQMIKCGEPALTIRNLFERIICMKLPAKKMKVFFKRYLEFEEHHGSQTTVQHVRSEAENYVKLFAG